VNFKSVSTRSYALHMEALATNWAVWRLRLLALGAARLGGLVRTRRAFRSSCVRRWLFSGSLRVVLFRSRVISCRYTLVLRKLPRRKL
jgi:hypothetical protein